METGETTSARREFSVLDIGERLFQWRDYTPIPLILLLFVFGHPTAASATLGTLLIIFGELIRIYSVSFIGGVSRTRSDSTGGEVVQSGAYGIVRNPLYIGNFFIALGFGVYSALAWLIVVTILLFAFQYFCIVKYEQTLLLERFGPAYERYIRTVPAWIPNRWPGLFELEWPVSFAPALKSEKRTLTTIFGMLLLLIIFKG